MEHSAFVAEVNVRSLQSSFSFLDSLCRSAIRHSNPDEDSAAVVLELEAVEHSSVQQPAVLEEESALAEVVAVVVEHKHLPPGLVAQAGWAASTAPRCVMLAYSLSKLPEADFTLATQPRDKVLYRIESNETSANCKTVEQR